MSVPAVSGPGQLARRTDRGPVQKLMQIPDAAYGEQATYSDLQRQAPLSQTPGPTPQPSQASDTNAGTVGAGGPAPTPLGAPTARPNDPMTPGNVLSPIQTGHPMAAEYQSGMDVLRAISGANSESSYLYQQLAGRGL